MVSIPALLRRPGLLVLATLALLAGPAAAAPEAVSINEVERGSLLLRSDDGSLVPAPLVDTAVEMSISGVVARVSVRQSFTQASHDWVNGIYAFPLPELAAVDRLQMQVGERTIEGHIEERDAARRTFEQARDAGRKASLVEQQRPNLFTTSVANIGPGETVVVEIEYQQTLDYENGEFSLRFPLTVGVRYIPGSAPVAGFDGGGWSFNTDQVPDASHVTPPVTAAGVGHDNPVSIAITLDAGMPLSAIESPWHAIVTREIAPGRHRIELGAGTVPADRDFELRFRPAPGHAPRAAFFEQSVDGERYGLMMLMPPEIAWAREHATAREVVYVIDTSGSMHGTSIGQARAALEYALTRLAASDTFNIIEFNSTVGRFSPQALPATPDNLARAKRWLAGLVADGGTEMAAALHAALDGGGQRERVRQVVFLTDGSVGNEQALLGIIDHRLGSSRLFTVGIGAAPNSYFMREAAQVGRGSFTYVGDLGEVQVRMRALIDKLEFPVLTDVSISAADGELESWPAPLKDLHVHEPIVASLRLDGVSELTVSGRFDGQPWTTRVPVTGGGSARGLDVVWARQKIASLERSLARGADRDAVREAITALGLAHHLVTAHTSLVAVDVTPTRPAAEGAQDALVPSKMPSGWAMQAPGLRVPQTATPFAARLLLALGLMLAGLVLRWHGARA